MDGVEETIGTDDVTGAEDTIGMDDVPGVDRTVGIEVLLSPFIPSIDPFILKLLKNKTEIINVANIIKKYQNGVNFILYNESILYVWKIYYVLI